jgi:hypothetical protein|eukprot:COSAG02_NODE_97_length_37159_cov_37.660335_18_plen_412_part_00
MKQATASTRARPAPPPASKRRTKKGEAARTRGGRHQRRKNERTAAAADDPNDLNAVFEMLQGSVGSDEQMLEMLQGTMARRNAENTAQERQPALPRVPGALLPVHQLQLELLQTLAEEERQASHLRQVGKQVQDAQLLEKLSLAQAARVGFNGIGTVASVRSPRAAPTLRRKPAAKSLTADEAFAQALSARQQQRPSATVTTWRARDSCDPRVREWLLNKEMQSASQQTLDLINWILILTRQGRMSEDRLRAEMAIHGPIPSAWLRQIRGAINNHAYTQRLEKKRGNRQPSPPRQRAGLLGISIQGTDGEHHIEHDEQIGLLPEDSSTPRGESQQENQAKDTLGDAIMRSVREAQVETRTGTGRAHTGVAPVSGGSSWVSRRRTGGTGLSPSEAAAQVSSSARARATTRSN